MGYNPWENEANIKITGEVDVNINPRDPALFEGDLSNVDNPQKTLPEDLTQHLGILIVKNITKSAGAHVTLVSKIPEHDKQFQMPDANAANVLAAGQEQSITLFPGEWEVTVEIRPEGGGGGGVL
jgi:hypothetical protein